MVIHTAVRMQSLGRSTVRKDLDASSIAWNGAGDSPALQQFVQSSFGPPRSDAMVSRIQHKPPTAQRPQLNSTDVEAKCKPSSDYQKFIDGAAEIIFDPKDLGDLNTLRNKYNCQIKSFHDA